MKQLWSSRMAQVAVRYGEHAPAATACCNACRTCVTTNVVGLATAGAVTAGLGAVRFARRLAPRP